MNYRDKHIKGMIVIGKGKTSQFGVMFHESTITYAEAKKYDPDLTEEDFDLLLGIKKTVKKSVKKDKVVDEKLDKQDNRFEK
jgi:hypothetical protein